MGWRKRSPASYEEANMNLTPLIDVIFVILVMFMIVAPMLNLNQIELSYGKADSSLPSLHADKSPIQIHVKNDNSILVNNQRIESNELLDTLKNLKSHFPEAKPLVFHDRKAFFGTYQQLKGSLEESGFDEMQIVLKPS